MYVDVSLLHFCRDFQVELENPHVIEKHQVWLGIIGKGPDSVLLSSTYENRYCLSYNDLICLELLHSHMQGASMI